MPAPRTLKPLLKLIVLVCVAAVSYRSFVQPRLSSSSSSSSSSASPRPTSRVGSLGTVGGRRGGGVKWEKEQQQQQDPSSGATTTAARHPPLRYEPPTVPLPPPPPLPLKEKEQQVLYEEIVKPKQVPGWVVKQELDRVRGNGEQLVPLDNKQVDEERGRGGGGEETFKKELDRMNQRKQEKEFRADQRNRPGGGGGGGDVEMIVNFDHGSTEEEGKVRVYHLVDEDDEELDAAQKGDGDARIALSGQRKKGPLIQVGGAGNAAGEKAAGGGIGIGIAGGNVPGGGGGGAAAGGGADAVKAKGKDKWKGKGWDQRFKKQGTEKERDQIEGNVAEESTNDGDAGAGKVADPAADAKKSSETLEENEQSNPEKLLVQHPLVARFLQQDISHNGGGGGGPDGQSQVTFVDPEDEDADAPRKPKNVASSSSTARERHNLTVCALVPNEQRFLPEWILYHSLLGISRFALYDTTLPGAFGGEEIDQLADSMRQEGGGGENAPTVEELKAQVAVSNAGREGLDEKGLIRRERVRGLEEWIDKGRVKMFFLKFKNPRASHDVHALMLEDCLERFGSTSNWLAHLDVDEFLSLSTPLYGSDEPYTTTSRAPTEDTQGSPVSADHVYPLHDLLSTPALETALCVPVPELNYRNLGVRELKRHQGVLETQVHRDVLGEVKESSSRRSEGERASLPQKTLIHTGFSSEPRVAFSGPHSCELLDMSDDPANGIRDSQGNVLDSRDGLYHAQNLPIEPLAIAHYVQRDLLDCHSKLSSVADPLSLLPKGRGSVSCEAHYLPSASELSSPTWRNDPANEHLRTVPPLGSVLEDRRMATSWAGRAAKTIGDAWRKTNERGMRRTSKSEREKLVSRVRHKVQVISY